MGLLGTVWLLSGVVVHVNGVEDEVNTMEHITTGLGGDFVSALGMGAEVVHIVKNGGSRKDLDQGTVWKSPNRPSGVPTEWGFSLTKPK